MALLAADGHLESSSNKSHCSERRTDGSSTCERESSRFAHRTPDLEIWKCGNARASLGASPLTFVCDLSPLGWLVYLSVWRRLWRKQGKGAFTEQPGVGEGEFQRNVLNVLLFGKCCPNLKTQWSMSNNTLKPSSQARDLSGAPQMSK